MKLLTINTLSELLDIVLQYNYNNRYWFRGQSNSSYKLIPSAYRELYIIEDQYHRPGEPRLMTDLDEGRGDSVYIPSRLYKTAFFEKLDSISVQYDKKMGIIEEFCFAQHYGLYTPMMDWTTDLSVALFFACDGNRCDTDAALFLVDPCRWNYHTSDNDKVFSMQEVEKIGTFLPVAMKGPQYDKRMCRQSGNFIVFGANVQPMERLNPPDETLIKIVIPKKLINRLKELLNAAGVNRNSIYVSEDCKDLISKEVMNYINSTVLVDFIKERTDLWNNTPESDRGISHHSFIL